MICVRIGVTVSAEDKAKEYRTYMQNEKHLTFNFQIKSINKHEGVATPKHVK